MSNLDVHEVERLNKVASQKNAERQQLIGKRDAAQQAFNQAIKVYESKYGVALTAENLQDEYNKVLEQTEKSYLALSEMIRKIENNEFEDTANKVEGSAEEVTSTNVVGTGNVVGNTGGNTFGSQSTVNAQPEAQHVIKVPETSQSVNQGVTGNAFGAPTGVPTFGTPVQSTPTVSKPVFGVDTISNDADISEQPVTPQSWGSDSINAEFESILGTDSQAVKFKI